MYKFAYIKLKINLIQMEDSNQAAFNAYLTA